MDKALKARSSLGDSSGKDPNSNPQQTDDHGDTKRKQFESFLQMQRTQALSQFYNHILAGKTRTQAFLQVSEGVNRGKTYWPRRLREWVRDFEYYEILPTSALINHSRTRSILLDPDIQFAIQKYLRSCKWAMDPSKLQRFFKNELSKEDAEAYAVEISQSDMPTGVSAFLRELAPAIDTSLPEYWDNDAQKRRKTQAPVHQIPHLLLGYVDGFHMIETYISFPALYLPSIKHFVISNEHWTLWTDHAFIPALQDT